MLRPKIAPTANHNNAFSLGICRPPRFRSPQLTEFRYHDARVLLTAVWRHQSEHASPDSARLEQLAKGRRKESAQPRGQLRFAPLP